MGFRKKKHNKNVFCFFFKIYNQSPAYLFNIIPYSNISCQTRNAHNVPQYLTKYTFSKVSFFLSTIRKWNRIGFTICNSKTLAIF